MTAGAPGRCRADVVRGRAPRWGNGSLPAQPSWLGSAGVPADTGLRRILLELATLVQKNGILGSPCSARRPAGRPAGPPEVDLLGEVP